MLLSYKHLQMEASTLKNKIHVLIDSSDEETLQSVYQLLHTPDYTDEFKNVLNEEYEAYQKNKEVISKEVMDKLIEELMRR